VPELNKYNLKEAVRPVE